MVWTKESRYIDLLKRTTLYKLEPKIKSIKIQVKLNNLAPFNESYSESPLPYNSTKCLPINPEHPV